MHSIVSSTNAIEITPKYWMAACIKLNFIGNKLSSSRTGMGLIGNNYNRIELDLI